MTERDLYSLLSLMMRAGKLKSGEFQTEEAVKSLEAKLVIVTADASDNTKKLFNDKCSFRNIPLVEFGTKEALGHAIGKKERSSVAISDEGFARSFLSKLNVLIKEEPN